MSWQEKLRQVEPYVAGEQPKIVNMIKLNTNENPYGPSEKVKEVLKEIDIDKLRLYPNSDAVELKQALANYYQLDEDQVFLGNGSDEVLALTFLTFFNGKDPILFPDITYSFYPVYCNLYQMDYQLVKLNDNFEINLQDFMQPNSGIIFPNPNAPTGVLVSVDFIETVVKNNPDSIVVVDEAYIDFGGTSCVPLINKYDNLVVIQTYSKSRSLAGIRLGIALGSKEAIRHLYDVKNSFNSYPVDYIAQQVCLASILDDQDTKQKCAKVIKTRERVKQELKQLGFVVLDSYANFVFVKHPQVAGEQLFLALRQSGIIVRHWNQERIDQFLRISIGTDEQMDRLITFLKTYLNNQI
ncbi:histidinol-phosphate transaminase [Thomasclavelia sp.]|uniref:histidinol-phosphate transaminase n=1 Tax=Thomasclavelia sp. TaxID=3025757 RepID=UPI0025DC50F4|nr:histidinol-phosphate transaminase [Thomasclavelia sp.]